MHSTSILWADGVHLLNRLKAERKIQLSKTLFHPRENNLTAERLKTITLPFFPSSFKRLENYEICSSKISTNDNNKFIFSYLCQNDRNSFSEFQQSQFTSVRATKLNLMA